LTVGRAAIKGRHCPGKGGGGGREEGGEGPSLALDAFPESCCLFSRPQNRRGQEKGETEGKKKGEKGKKLDVCPCRPSFGPLGLVRSRLQILRRSPPERMHPGGKKIDVSRHGGAPHRSSLASGQPSTSERGGTKGKEGTVLAVRAFGQKEEGKGKKNVAAGRPFRWGISWA